MEDWEKFSLGGVKIHEIENDENKKQPLTLYQKIISVENLLDAWREFLAGKKKRKDVAEFAAHLMDYILALHQDLINKTYRHGPYTAFKINDPKPRDIHKASVRDRLLHHATYRILYPFFDTKFIFDSFSCRRGKGVQRAINRFREISRRVSKNHTRTVWVLKCDIKKFFANIDHAVLKNILAQYINDGDILWLLDNIIDSFYAEGNVGIGLPLGNLTSQLLVNVYMNVFDHFLKRKLKVSFCIRYADDFVIMHKNRKYLENILPRISLFLEKCLKLSLHPNKIFITTLASGVDFLGWVHFPHYLIIRNVTRRRILKGIKIRPNNKTLQSYLGLIGHGNTYGLKQEVLNWYRLGQKQNNLDKKT